MCVLPSAVPPQRWLKHSPVLSNRYYDGDSNSKAVRSECSPLCFAAQLAEMARRKLLEDSPIPSTNEEPVLFDTSEIPWWAWVRRFHLPEVRSGCRGWYVEWEGLVCSAGAWPSVGAKAGLLGCGACSVSGVGWAWHLHGEGRGGGVHAGRPLGDPMGALPPARGK